MREKSLLVKSVIQESVIQEEETGAFYCQLLCPGTNNGELGKNMLFS